MKSNRLLLEAILILFLGLVAGGLIVHSARKVYDPGTVKVAVSEEAVTHELPTEFTVGGRTYEVLPFLKSDEGWIDSETMFARATEMGANVGEEDAKFILEHQAGIPPALRSIYLFFPKWRKQSGDQDIAYIVWGGGKWYHRFHWINRDWDGHNRMLRRKS